MCQGVYGSGFFHGDFLVEGDFAFLVDDDGAAFGAVEGFFAGEHGVGFGHFSGGVGEEGVGDVVVFFEGGVGEGAVAGDTEDDGVGVGGDFAELRAEGAVFVGADGAEIHGIEEEEDVFLAAEVGEFDFGAGFVHELEIWGGVAGLQHVLSHYGFSLFVVGTMIGGEEGIFDFRMPIFDWSDKPIMR